MMSRWVYIASTPQYKRLSALIPVTYINIGARDFDGRYSSLIETLKDGLHFCLDQGSFLSPMVADLVMAQGYVGKLFEHLENGHDSVFVLPSRSAAESMSPILQRLPDALPAEDLCKLCFENLHPLWIACIWDSPLFSKLPYCLLWKLKRSWLVQPIVTGKQIGRAHV